MDLSEWRHRGSEKRFQCNILYVLKHVDPLKQALLLRRRRSVSASSVVSYRHSTMPTVVSHDIFPWSPVSTYKSQQRCQNSRTVSAESICKVSSWAILLPLEALECPVILCCLWPLSAAQSFFTAVLRITLVSYQSASIYTGSGTVQKNLAFG